MAQSGWMGLTQSSETDHANDKPVAAVAPLATGFGVIAMLMGGAVFLAWAADIPLVPGRGLMPPFAALAFVSCGLALALHRSCPWCKALLAPAALAAIGALWLHLAYYDSGIDYLLAPQSLLGPKPIQFPGRMGTMTALEFLLFCFCFTLPYRHPWINRLLSFLTTLGLILALISVASYAVGAQGVSRTLGGVTMPPDAAMGFLLLFAGLKLARPFEGWFGLLLSRTSGGSVMRLLLPLIIGWPLGAGLLSNQMTEVGSADPHLMAAVVVVLVIIGQMGVTLRFASHLNRSEWERAEAKEKLRRRNAWLDVLADGAHRLLSSETPEHIVQELCERVMTHLDCQVFANFISVPGEPRMQLIACAGLPRNVLAAKSCLQPGLQARDCIHRLGCQRCGDCCVDLASEAAGKILVGASRIQAYACHPLLYQGRNIGTLAFGSRVSASFSDEEMELMRTVADLVAAALARKQSEEILRESETRFRSTFEQAAVGLCHADESGRFLWVNEKYCAITGYSREELLTMRFQDITFPEDVYPNLDGRSQLLAGSIQGYTMEKRYIRKDGKVIWIHLSISLIRKVTGEPDYFLAAAEDIQQRKEVEQALTEEREARHRILERQVAERTAELQASNRQLEGFLYAASHDLKGPLGRISSFSSLLERHYRQHLEGDGLMFLDFIRENAIRLNKLIDDLLSHARIDQQNAEHQPVEIKAAVEAVLRERGEDIRETGTAVRIDLTATRVLADPYSLSQVLTNLLENAHKYSANSPGPAIEIGGESAGGRFRLWVRDNGIGFDMAYHDKIFEIFRRLHTYAEYAGSGVGLALVKRAMERMGGRVWAESEPGRGATFFLEFAMADEVQCLAAPA